jgi:hypothetical protein
MWLHPGCAPPSAAREDSRPRPERCASSWLTGYDGATGGDGGGGGELWKGTGEEVERFN